MTVATIDELARYDDGDRSVRVERRHFTGGDGRPRRMIAVSTYERLFVGGWTCRKMVTLRAAEIDRVIEGLSRARAASSG